MLEFSGLVLTGRSFEVKIKDRASDTTRATLTIGSGLTITGSNVFEAAYAKAGMTGWPRGEYSADVVDVTGGAHSRVMAVRFVLDLPGRLVQGVRDRKAYINWSPNQAVVASTGAIGPAGPRGPAGDTGAPGADGTDGLNAWTPELALVSDSLREVQQVVDWFGGSGTKPATGLYVGDTGLVTDIVDAKDIRGPIGPGIGPSDFASQAEAEAGTISDKAMSPLRSSQQIDARVGTGAGSLAAGDDPRFSDERTPEDGSVSDVKVATPVTASDAIASTKIKFVASGSSFARFIQDKARDVVSICDFGAVGDNSTDCRAAIQAAHDALGASGGALYVPRGVFRVSGAVNITNPITLYGDGEASRLRTTSATANILTTSAQRVGIKGLNFDSAVTRTGGWYVDVLSSVSRFRLSDFFMSGAIGGIRTAGIATITIERGEILDSVLTTGVPIRIDGGIDVSIRDVLTDQGGEVFAAVYITEAGDVTIDDCQLINGGSALFADIASGKTLASLWSNNTFFDNSGRGVYLKAAGNIVRCLFDQCWFSSSDLEGMRIEALTGGLIDGVDVTNCHGFANASNAINVLGANAKNVRVSGGAYAGNGDAALRFGAGVTQFGVHGARIGASYGFGVNAAGITFDGSNNYFQIIGNDMRDNTVGAFFGAPAADTYKVFEHNMS